MKKESRFVFAISVLITAMLACANPMGGNAPAPANVETIVAQTFAALTAPVVEISATPTPQAPAQPDVTSQLPHSMYFLNNDGAGLAQVYRLDKDGKTITQITFEPAKVDYYDVSTLDGSVAYTSNNQLLAVNADGSNRRLLLDGGPRDENNYFLSNISNPVFSPNGQTIAFGYKGLNFYSIASGQYNNVLENQIEDQGNGFLFPKELYWPEEYTADGSKLVISLGYYEGASAAIYYPNGNALVRLNGADGSLICCGNTNWTTDGSAFYAANAYYGMFNPGLWRVDSASGAVTTLVNGDAGNGTFNFPSSPYLAPDGQLYFFFVNQALADDFSGRPPLQLVRSAADGVTGRTVIIPDVFNTLNEALWAPDGSFVVTASGPIAEVYQGGLVELYYTDGQRAMTSLLPFASKLKWGP